ncbi:MAG: T9SS type A sorting domain-containing protein, partial [Bacteroidetes bacterium]|nr:T9SS type A sorting domain-containing protein [Bacteroidota bacterium]
VGASSPYIRLGVTSIYTGIDEYESQNGLTLYQNVPNPANSSTVIKYDVEKNSEVKFSVYDIAGRKLIDKSEGNVTAGEHNINIDLATFTKGVYFYTLTANGHSLTKKMVILE